MLQSLSIQRTAFVIRLLLMQDYKGCACCRSFFRYHLYPYDKGNSGLGGLDLAQCARFLGMLAGSDLESRRLSTSMCP